MPNLKLYLDNGNTYFAGDVIKGFLDLSIKKKKKVKSLVINIYGYSDSEIKTNNKKYRLKENYVKKKIIFINHKNPVKIQGSYRYFFEFQLNHGLPQSSSDNYICEVKYYCEAVLDVFWSLKRRARLDFIVKRRDNLNWFPILSQPVTRTDENNIFMRNLSSEPIRMTVTIPKSGYAFDEVVPINVKVDNKSQSGILSFKFILEEWKQAFYKGREIETRIKVLLEEYENGIGPCQSTERDHNLKIPNIINISDLIFSRSVKIKHFIRVIAKMSGLHQNLNVLLPIVIGSVPLKPNEISNETFSNNDAAFRDHLLYIYPSNNEIISGNTVRWCC